MDDLVQWLTAQLDEEQGAAEDALKRATTTRRRIGGQWIEDTIQPPEWRRSAWPPARVLREIDADRALIADYVTAQEIADATTAPDMYDVGRARGLEEAVCRRATSYADRPGYKESWRP